jgi:hypothetical protein
VTINYMQMLLDLMEERQKWIEKRDESIREISRLSELVRATMNMIPADQIARYEPIFERIEKRPAGLSTAIRACFTAGATGPSLFGVIARSYTEAGKAEESKPGAATTGSEENTWLTPVEIRDALKRMGFPFENYKANPLASIHTTLKRMVPAEMDVKILKDGQKAYRLKSAGEWTQAFAEVRQWLKGNFESHKTAVNAGGGTLIGVRPRNERNEEETEQKSGPEHKDKPEQKDPSPEGAKRGTSGGA